METDPIIPNAPEFSGASTYCPEDNKLRLYIGRVPRDEYLKLRAEGWTALHKQREAGGGDFVAHWTPDRRDTALEYAGVIEDEDMSPAERAADRAERFAGYREKRTDEATGRADNFDAGPAVHGFQSQARAERSARRHDRIAGRAVDAWGKAEYWQSRTAGVISHALHVSTPSVRMGRIKELEADIRKQEKERAEYVATREKWMAIAADTDPAKQDRHALIMAGGSSDYWAKYQHPRQPAKESLWDLLHADRHNGDAITGAEAAALYLAKFGELHAEGDWLTHYRLRLAYENQMLEAQGGRAAFVEMQVGGWLGGHQIRKVNKSPATGRVVSVALKCKGDQYGRTKEGFHLGIFNIERLPSDSYRAPTAEDLAALEAEKSAEKAARPKVKTIPLVNPTDADAERLQAVWNAKYATDSSDSRAREVLRCTQAVYSANSGFRTDTIEITGGGFRLRHEGHMSRPDCPIVAKVRACGGRVVVLTDKPQKAFAANVWHDPRPGIIAELAEDFAQLNAAVCANYYQRTDEQTAIFNKARIVGLTYCDSTSQYGFTENGHKWAKAQKERRAALVAAPAFTLESV